MQAAAAAASKNAEQDLLKQFGSLGFKTNLMLQGGYKAWPLASIPAADLLAQVKGALETLEYVTNFGVDPAYQKAHPGEPVLVSPPLRSLVTSPTCGNSGLRTPLL